MLPYNIFQQNENPLDIVLKRLAGFYLPPTVKDGIITGFFMEVKG